MKKIFLDSLFGFLIVIVVTVLEFLVTLPFGEPGEFNQDYYLHLINREFLLTALPAGVTTFTFTQLLKTQSRKDARRRGIIWTVILFLNYLIIGIGNDNFKMIFGTFSIYVMLACAYLGTVLYSKIKQLK